MCVVVDAQLVWDGQEQRVGLSDCLVLCQLADEGIRLDCSQWSGTRLGLYADSMRRGDEPPFA